jgi:hypothetical protein
MSKISEFFGLYCGDENANINAALNSQMCPYIGRICTKMRKSDPDVKIGTCSVKYQNSHVIICPFRLLEHNQIFIDCLHLLTMHEPGNELYLVPEVQIPGGHVDYFLVSAKNKKVKDFIGIELQTMDTTGTVWPDRQKFLNERGISVNEEDVESKKSYGMNWKMTLKTILIQMHHKSETFEHLNKHLVLIIQKPLFEHMKSDFDFGDIEGVRLGDPVHIHSYDFTKESNKMCLSLDTRVSTDSAGIAKCLGLNAESKVELQDLIAILEPKLTEEHRLIINIPSK